MHVFKTESQKVDPVPRRSRRLRIHGGIRIEESNESRRVSIISELACPGCSTVEPRAAQGSADYIRQIRTTSTSYVSFCHLWPKNILKCFQVKNYYCKVVTRNFLSSLIVWCCSAKNPCGYWKLILNPSPKANSISIIHLDDHFCWYMATLEGLN